jgi:hypothetical protein
MAARVHRPLKVTVFNVNDIWKQRYEVTEQLKDRCGSDLRDTSQTP